jgi:hypothetical protein
LVRQDLFFGSHDFFLLRDLNFADGAAGATAGADSIERFKFS